MNMMTPRDFTRVWEDIAAKLRQSLRHLEILLTPGLYFTSPILLTSIRKT